MSDPRELALHVMVILAGMTALAAVGTSMTTILAVPASWSLCVWIWNTR